MMNISLIDIYKVFFILGVQLLGGGYAIIPIMKKSVVEDKMWISDEELINFYALSQSIPGIIAANISIFTGYKLRGKRGAATALFGITTSPVITILIIAGMMNKILNAPLIDTIFWAVGIAVIILVYITVKEMWSVSITDWFSVFIFVACLISSLVFNIAPATIIVCAIFAGLIYAIVKRRSSL